MKHVQKITVAFVLAATLLVSAMLPSCAGGRDSVKVGAVYPLTGSLATAGENARNGILFAVDIVNNEYDLDLPLAASKGISSLGGAVLEVIFEDSRGSPDTGKSAARRLIDEEEVVALIGCYQSAVTETVSRTTEEKGVPFITATSTAPSLTRQGLEWFFRTTPDGEVFTRNFFQFLEDVRELGGTVPERTGIVYEDSVWGTEVAEFAEQYAGAYGYQVIKKIPYSSDAADVSGEVQRLKDARVGLVLQASYTADAILYMETYKEMDFSPVAILADDAGFAVPEFCSTLEEKSNYVFVRQAWSADLADVKPLVAEVTALYRQKYGTDMDDTCARIFTGMLVLADAIDRAGSTEPAAIREALLATDIPGDKLITPWDGVRFDPETHQNVLAKGVICQIIDREYRTVWPWDLAAREIVWPMPAWNERE